MDAQKKALTAADQDSYLQEKINAFTAAHKGEDPEDIIAACRGYEEQGENSVPSETSSEKELAETYLRVLNKKFPILPTLKGKQLADYKNFLNKCQQIFGLKEWGIHPTQSKLFEKLSLIWAVWGAEHLKDLGKSDNEDPCHTCDHPVLSCSAFPCEKKQAEQKPTEWSEEDSYMLAQAIKCVNNSGKLDVPTEEIEDWLKSLKPQPKQEWSETDKSAIIVLTRMIKQSQEIDPLTYTEPLKVGLYAWLNSLKERVQPTAWKPGSDQFGALQWAIEQAEQESLYVTHQILASLMGDLKKLNDG